MSTGTNNLTWSSGNWRGGAGYGAHTQNSDSNRMNSPVSQTPTFRPADAGGRTTDTSWQFFEERVRTGPNGLTGFPGQPLPPIRIFILDGETAPGVNPQLRQFVREPPPTSPTIRGQQHIPPQEESRRIEEQLRKAQLKKHKYNPAKSKSKRWCLYYRENANNSSYSAKGRDDDDKACSVCLEDFAPGEELLITPCKHMFHEECILPWVNSNGQCPVCRFSLCDTGGRALSQNNHPGIPVNDRMPGDFIALVRAMEEAFDLMTVPR
ncbi:E3 ubiquitin-protein ligase RNF12-like [Macadamia integrifolia]|uniref:E3 ubiquitin-protein ligase RNF12-like n=1 Tax=Macadamia integrifolia TaxID=60698 RepID=UPI001C4EAF36|nr:E3 ubiquitin-protein ligase RNF12-like [Macadamia integrifolia]